MKRTTRWRIVGVLVSLSLTTAVLLCVLTKDKFIEAGQTLGRVSPSILLVFPLYIAWNLLAVFGWRTVLVALRPKTKGGVLLMLLSRLSAQSFNTVVPTGGLGGEVLRSAALTRLGASLPVAGAATFVDNVAGVVGGLFFAAVVVPLGAWNRPTVRTASSLTVLLVSFVIAVALSSLPQWLARCLARYCATRSSSTNSQLLGTMQSRSFAKALLMGIGWRTAERLLMAAEVWLGFWALGKPIPLLDACLIVAALVFVSLVFFLVPAQLGAAEGAIVAVSGLLGIAPGLALSVALLRRSRQVVTALGGLLLVPWVAPAMRLSRQVWRESRVSCLETK